MSIEVTPEAVDAGALALRDSLYPYLSGTPLSPAPVGDVGYRDYVRDVLRAAVPLLRVVNDGH